MLTPEYLEECADYILGLYDELDRAIIADISRRIVKTGGITATAAHQTDKVQQSGLLLEDVIRQIAAVNNFSEDEVKRLFNEAGILSIRNDAKPLIIAGKQTDVYLSKAMKDLLNANISKTNGYLRNLTMTTGSTASNAYMEAVNKAMMKVQSGAFTPQQAIREAVKETAVDGNYVMYPSGHRDRIDVAVRRSVMTGLNQSAAKLTEMYAADMGVEYYETTAHYGARPEHVPWQGRVFKIEGSTAQYPNFYDSTGYGTGAGLCGWNCRHSFYPFWPGISLPAYTRDMLEEYDRPKYLYKGRKLTEYEVSQLMRANERSIRETKRELAGYKAAIDATDDQQFKASLQADFDATSMKLKNKEARYKDLCKQTKHSPDSSRTGVAAVKDEEGRIVSWNRSIAQRARYGAEREFQRTIAGTGADIGGPATHSKRNELRYNNKQESALYDQYLRQVKKGTASPLSTFGNYKKQHENVERDVVGIKTANGTEITAQSNHFIERVIGTMEDPKAKKPRSGVSVKDIVDALKNPLKVNDPIATASGDRSQKHIGRKATVSVNPDTGVLIQCNPTGTKMMEGLMKK